MSEALAAAKIRAYSVMVPVPVRFYARNAGQTLAKKSLFCSKTDRKVASSRHMFIFSDSL